MANGEEQSLKDAIRSKIPPKVQTWWHNTNSALWFLPTIAVVAAGILAPVIVYIDDSLMLWQESLQTPWLFAAGAEGARGVLSAIASSTITVIGTVFSITIVGLQLASSQFTPRVLRQFTRDRINQTVLAAFIGTFTYCLLVLRTIQVETDEAPGFVPVIGVTVGIVLAMVCIALLILFIHHIARQMQVAYILERATQDALGLVENYFREEITVPPYSPKREFVEGGGRDVVSDSAGYLQHYDYEHLLGTAESRHLTIRMLVPMGAYVNRRQAIARIWTARSEEVDLKEAADGVRGAFVTGAERTLYADLALGLRQIVDIGVKAMSPGINDPTTATQALDRISEVLARAGSLESPDRILYVDDRPAVYLPKFGFDELANIAFTQIRHYAQADLVVMLHLVRVIERVASLVQERCHPTLIRQLDLAKAAGNQGLTLGPEREALAEVVDASIARIREYVDYEDEEERVPVVPDIIQEV